MTPVGSPLPPGCPADFVTRLADRWLPSLRLAVVAGPGMLAYTVAAARGVGWLRATRGVAAPYTRKIFHFLTFTTAGAVHLAWGRPGVVLFGAVVAAWVLVAVARGDGDPFYEALARPRDAPRRTLFILVPLATTALGGVVANLLFPKVAHVGYLVSGWGDASAEPVGELWGRHRYSVPSLAGVSATRSLEGSASVLAVGSVAATLALAAGGAPAPRAVAAGLACGVAATGVEAVSNHGVDNFTVQVAAAAVAAALSP